MKKQNLVTLLILAGALSGLWLRAPKSVAAQERAPDERQTGLRQIGVSQRQLGSIRIPVSRTDQVGVNNRTRGRITIVGWDQEIIEATATSERGPEIVRVETTEGNNGRRIYLTTDYAPPYMLEEGTELSSPAPVPQRMEPSPTPSPAPSPVPNPPQAPSSVPPQSPAEPPSSGPLGGIRAQRRGEFFFRPLEIHIEVKLPRYIEIEPINVNRSEVNINGIETPLVIDGGISALRLARVGAVAASTRRGNIYVEQASGQVSLVTANGDIQVRHAAGDVGVVSIGGDINISCARGRVVVNNTTGAITLSNISGDADATSFNGAIRFIGAIREGGRYRLTSTSGAVEMTLPANTAGFTLMLSSYTGVGTRTDFPLTAINSSESNRRTTGRHGNGRAQITLDTFNGSVHLRRATSSISNDCR